MSSLGTIHLIFAIAALMLGGLALRLPKGSLGHRACGYSYTVSLLSVNVTALSLYRLTGGFNAFHALALLSLITLAAGAAAIMTKRPRGRWLARHYACMSWSYVGLVAAAMAETIVRLVRPEIGLNLALLAAGATIAVTLAGGFVIRRHAPANTLNPVAALAEDAAP